MENNFKFFLPVDIEKGKKDAKGQQEMRIKGLASTGDTDEQGEDLDSSGFDLSYFKSHGHLNLNHSKTGLSSAIGKPTSAILTKKGLEIEGLLYNDNPVAVETYELAQILQKNSPDRRMGLSIEGTVLERDKLNPKKIKKAKITGCALTISPINPNTYVEVMKGFDNGLNWKYELTEEGDKKYLLHVLDEQNGQDVKVDTDYNISITKALEAGSMTGTEITNSTEASGAALKAEDLEHSENEVIEKKKKKNEKYLSKSEAYEQIFQDLHTIDLKSIARIYQLAQKISHNMSSSKPVTLDALNKAYQALGIKIPSTTDNNSVSISSVEAICKSMIAEDDQLSKSIFVDLMGEDGIDKEIAEKAFDNITKGMKSDDDDQDDDDQDEIETAKANVAIRKAKKAGKKKKEIEEILKSMNCKSNVMQKALDSIEDDEEGDQKAIKDLKKGLSSIEQLIVDQNQKQAQGLELIFKSFTEQLAQNQLQLESLHQKVAELEEKDSTPIRKSLVTTAFREKGAPTSQTPGAKNVLNMNNSAQKAAAVDLLSKAIDWDNIDVKTQRLAEQCAHLEATGNLMPEAANFFKSHNIEILS